MHPTMHLLTALWSQVTSEYCLLELDSGGGLHAARQEQVGCSECYNCYEPWKDDVRDILREGTEYGGEVYRASDNQVL